MPFPARAPGTCSRCSRPFDQGEQVTSSTPPNVAPARFEHAPRCPMTPVAAPPLPRPLVEPVEVPRSPLRVRGRLAGHLFEMTIEGLPVDLLRMHADGIEIRVTPAAAMAAARRTA